MSRSSAPNPASRTVEIPSDRVAAPGSASTASGVLVCLAPGGVAGVHAEVAGTSGPPNPVSLGTSSPGASDRLSSCLWLPGVRGALASLSGMAFKSSAGAGWVCWPSNSNRHRLAWDRAAWGTATQGQTYRAAHCVTSAIAQAAITDQVAMGRGNSRCMAANACNPELNPAWDT